MADQRIKRARSQQRGAAILAAVFFATAAAGMYETILLYGMQQVWPAVGTLLFGLVMGGLMLLSARLHRREVLRLKETVPVVVQSKAVTAPPPDGQVSIAH